MGNSFWVWLFLIGAWDIVLIALFNQVLPERILKVLAVIFLFLGLIAAVGGSVEFLRATQSWPFNPQ